MGILEFGEMVDLVQEAPKPDDAYMLEYVGEHLKDYSDEEIDAIYNKYKKILDWSFKARIIFITIHDHDHPEESKYSFLNDIEDYDRKKYYWISNIEYAPPVVNSIFKIYCYHRDEVVHRLKLKREVFADNKGVVIQHPDSLLDVVNGLPQYDKSKFLEQYHNATKEIHKWLDIEKTIWDDDLLKISNNEKMGQYLFRKTTKMLLEFHDYVPSSMEEWDEMRDGDGYYYSMAMEYYYFEIRKLILLHDIEETGSIKKIYDLCWFMSDTDDFFDYINPADLHINDETQSNNSSIIDSDSTGKRFSLPDDINTEHVYDCINKAIDANYISIIDNNHLEWLGNNGNKTLAHLAYFCGVIFGYNKDGSCNGNAGNHVPYKALEDLFSVKRLDRALSQVHEAKKPQVWRKKYDDLLK